MSDERERVEEQERERVEHPKVEDDDFEGHQLEVERVEEGGGEVDIGKLEESQIDVGS